MPEVVTEVDDDGFTSVSFLGYPYPIMYIEETDIEILLEGREGFRINMCKADFLVIAPLLSKAIEIIKSRQTE